MTSCPHDQTPGIEEPTPLSERIALRIANRFRWEEFLKPRRRPWRATQAAVGVATVITAAGIGIGATLIWEMLRLAILDGQQTWDVGYRDGGIPQFPHDLNGDLLGAVSLLGLMAWMGLMPWATHLRRRCDDPVPWLLPGAASLLGAVAAGIWFATDAHTPTERPWTALDRVVLTSNVWLPLALVAAAAAMFWLWQAARNAGLQLKPSTSVSD
ncbi:hypothetical protein [Nocardioides daejeonensis]|uniref:hypothetical protein n=1 Tax=Nocardioides daejeonensis TaxID=1046556 RepID=UPI000D747359|nr:hypothetical protein [Nocardioides daejeonensis]